MRDFSVKWAKRLMKNEVPIPATQQLIVGILNENGMVFREMELEKEDQ